MSMSPWYGVVGWTYDAAFHCNSHAIERFTQAGLFDRDTVDSEGNPLHPVYSWDEAPDFPDVCDECIATFIQNRPASHSDQDIDTHNAAGTYWVPCETCGTEFSEPDMILGADGYLHCSECHEVNNLPRMGSMEYAESIAPEFPDDLRTIVTPAGIQYLLPGETPPPVRKGDATDQTRMF